MATCHHMSRIQIGREAARALKIAAAMRDMRPHELMEELITRHCGQMAMKPELPLDSEKIASRKTAPLEEDRQKGSRPWHGGPPPYEEQHPEVAARVLELWAGGKRKGGLSRDAVARKLQAEGIEISAAQVDKITIRKRKNI